MSTSHPYSDPMNMAKGQNIPTLLSHILSSASGVIWDKSLNFPVPQIPGLRVGQFGFRTSDVPALFKIFMADVKKSTHLPSFLM